MKETRGVVDTSVRVGAGRFQRDAYHAFLEASWPRLVAVLVALYLVANAIFAALYLLQPGSIENAEPGSFADAFFFSVQTMATIGYGRLVPNTRYANLLVVLETSTGIMGLAMLTGLVFAKFSRPTARVMFSNRAVITIRDGAPSLLFRMANGRTQLIVEAEAHVVLARTETTLEGEEVRRFYDLELSRSRNAIFALTWLAIHPITESSPLYGATPESVAANQTEIIVSVVGIDETLAQAVHARHSYPFDRIVWGARYVDVVSHLPDGRLHVDLTHFHDIVEAPSTMPPWLTAGGRRA